MERRAAQSSGRISSAASFGWASFFRTIEQPASSMRRHFERMAAAVDPAQEKFRKLGEQSHATGEEVERGMSRATASVRAFGVAGLAAFATYEVLNKAFGAVNSVAGRVMQTGLAAAPTGVGLNEFSALSQALFTHGLVPEEQTQSWMENYSYAVGAAAGGNPQQLVDFYRRLAGAGNVAQQYGATQEQAQQFQDIQFGEKPEQLAFDLARILAQMPEQAAFQAGHFINLTDEQVRGFRRTGPDLPNLTAASRETAITNQQQQAALRLTEAENKLATAWENLFRTIMLGGLADSLTRFANWLNAISGGPPEPSDTRTRWERILPNFLGGKPEPGANVTGAGAGGIVQAARAAGANDSAVAVMLSAAMGEGAPGGDFSNPWRQNQQGSGAVGYWQLLPRSGELPRYLAEGNPPGDTIAQTRFVLKRLNEIMPGFSTSTDQQAQLEAITKFERSGQGSEYYGRHILAAQRFVAGTGTEVAGAAAQPDRSLPNQNQLSVFGSEEVPAERQTSGATPQPGATTQSWLDAIEGRARAVRDLVIPPAQSMDQRMHNIQRERAASSSETHHHYNRGDVTNHVTVHAPTREGREIGQSVSEHLQKLTPTAVSANSGLE